MTITRIGNRIFDAGDPLTTASTKLYFNVGFHDDVKLVIINTGGVNNITVTSVYGWTDPQKPLARSIIRPSATADIVDTITFTTPVTTANAEVAYPANDKVFTHIEVDLQAAAATTTGEVYILGRVH